MNWKGKSQYFRHSGEKSEAFSRRQFAQTLMGALASLAGPALPAAQIAGESVPTKGTPPRWFAYRCPYSIFEAETLRRFAKVGVEVVHISPLNTLTSLGVPYSPFPPSWVGPGQYDFSSVDRYMAEVRANHPRAKVICGIDLNTPAWWPRALWSRRRIDSFCELGRIAASQEWREETRGYLQEFLRHTETNYPEIIIGYTLFCGMTLEWQDHSLGQESASKRAAWRQWVQSVLKKADPVDIPPASVRERCSRGFFRDPVQDSVAIDYWRFSHWLIGDTILFFAAAAQEVLKHRVPLGTFYGYILEHGQGQLLTEGHLDFDRVFSSPLIDFFIAPASYVDRSVGGAGTTMVPLHSLKHHKKGFIRELDHRTHTCPGVTLLGKPAPGYSSGFPNREATIAGLRREFASALIHGISLWWFNIFGHLYDDEEVVEAIGQMHEIWKNLPAGADQPVAEVAVLVDPESIFYVDGQSPLINDLLSRQRIGLGRMGAPYEIYSFADLPELDLSRHKLVILPNLFVVDERKRSYLRSRLFSGNKTLVWIYAPGIIADDRFDPANVERLIGIPLDVRELTERRMDGWISVFSPTPNLSATTLRQLAARAGVHIYSDSGEPIYASRQLLAAHTADGGERIFRLPTRASRVRELFSGRVVAESASEFRDRLKAPDTVLYLIELE